MTSVSITEIAKLAGVSIATVSRCINNPKQVRDKTREKVQKAIKETGFSVNTVAQNFRRGKTNMIMVVIPSIGEPFFTDVMHGLRSEAQKNGYSLLINENHLDNMSAEEIDAMMLSRQVDGIILLASMSPFGSEVISGQSNRRLPIVIGCEAITEELKGLPSVHIDNFAAAQEATDYLISLGHKHIAFMAGEETSLLTKDRENGYASAVKKAGLSTTIASGNLTIAGARTATVELLNLPDRPTAIFCATDEMAIGTLHEIKAAGLSVPSDISVMGFDNNRYAAVMDPPLTTIGQPAAEIGRRTAKRMIKAIEHGLDNSNKPDIIEHKLIIRSSVGKK